MLAIFKSLSRAAQQQMRFHTVLPALSSGEAKVNELINISTVLAGVI